MEDDSIAEDVKSESKWDASTTVPEVEVHLYVKGEGPLYVFKCPLGGCNQDKLNLLKIRNDYGLKVLYAFSPSSGRGQRLTYPSGNGLSKLSFTEKQVCIDGDPTFSDMRSHPLSKADWESLETAHRDASTECNKMQRERDDAIREKQRLRLALDAILAERDRLEMELAEAEESSTMPAPGRDAVITDVLQQLAQSQAEAANLREELGRMRGMTMALQERSRSRSR